MDKIVYKDGENTRILKGTIETEDDFFITLILDSCKYRISKRDIISIRQDKVRQDENTKTDKSR